MKVCNLNEKKDSISLAHNKSSKHKPQALVKAFLFPNLKTSQDDGMVITCFHHSWSWSSKLVQFESGDGLTGNEMIQSEYRLVAMACAYFLEKQRKKVKPNLKLMALLDLHMNHGSRCWAIPCCYVDCMKCFKVQGKFIIPCSSKQQCHPALTPHNGIQHGTTSRLSKCVKTTPAYCIQQWHPAMARYWHPSMASSNGTQQWRPTTWHPAKAPYHGTQHPAMAPRNGTQHPAMAPTMATTAPSNGTRSSLSKCHNHSPPIASSNGTQQWHLTTWHPAMAPDHGTQQWHHVQSVKVCHNHSPPLASSNGSSNGTQHPAMASYHMAPTMASSNGTLPWHLTMAPSNGTAAQQWHPATSPHPIRQLVHPPPPITSNGSPAMAPSNGSQQRYHVQSANVYTHPPLSPAMAPSNGSQQRQPRPIRQRVHPPPPEEWH